MYFMLILVSGAKMQLPLQLGVTDRQTYSMTTVTLCACALRVKNSMLQVKRIIIIIAIIISKESMDNMYGPHVVALQGGGVGGRNTKIFCKGCLAWRDS